MATFVDTNVAVYVFDRGSEVRRRQAIELFASPPDQLVVSTQVLSEFFSVITRKLEPPLNPAQAGGATRQLAALPVVATDRSLVLSAIDTAAEHQLALWDALIVEAAVRGGCDRILTEDLGDGQEIRGVRIENPFQ